MLSLIVPLQELMRGCKRSDKGFPLQESHPQNLEKMNIDSEWRDSPVMPLCYDEPEHIQRDDSPFAFNGWPCVARVLKKKEVAANPKAQAAMAAEWEALTKMKTWSLDQVREWSDVAAEARREGKRVHIGRVFGFVSEKGSELPEGHPDRKYKGRAVFQGDNVRDEDNYRALFEDLGSSPASMAAGKFADYVGLQNGCACEIDDALRAYTQSLLSLVSNTATWVRLPKEIQPSEWQIGRAHV